MVLPASERLRPYGQTVNGTGRSDGRAHSGRHDPDVASFVALAPRGNGELDRQPFGEATALFSLNLGVVDEEVRHRRRGSRSRSRARR